MNNTLDLQTAQVLKLLASFCGRHENSAFDTSSLIVPHAVELLKSDLLQCRSSSSQPSLSDLHLMSKTTSTQFRETFDFLENADTIARLLERTADLLSYVSLHFNGVGNHVETKDFGAQSLLINNLVYGASHWKTLSAMSRLAMWIRYVGEYEHAEQLLRQVVTICESKYGFPHTFTLEALLELRKFLALREREQEAKEACEIGIRRCQDSLLIHQGKEHLEILLKLTEFQLENGDFAEAERSARLALHRCEAVNNVSHFMKAIQHLSDSYEKQNSLELAVGTKRTEVDFSIRVWGPNSLHTLSLRYDLVRILLKDRRLEEARRQALVALEPISQIYGPSSDSHACHYGIFDQLFSMHGGLICPQRPYDDNQRALPMAENNTTVAKTVAS